MFQLPLTVGFPGAPLILEFPLRAFSRAPGSVPGVSGLGNAECGSLPRQRDQRSSELPQGAEGLLPGAAALPEDTAGGVKTHFPMINSS